MNGTSRPIVAVASEQRLVVVDGRPWAPPSFAHDYWASFLGVPTDTILIARSQHASRVPKGYEALDGPNVEAMFLPPLQPDARLLTQMLRSIWRLCLLDRRAALILRAPGMVSSLALLAALVTRRPFAVQVVGDPIDVTFVAGVGGALGRLAGALMAAATTVACRKSLVISYVTGHYLQERYRPRRGARVHAISNVQLPDRLPAHDVGAGGDEVTIVTVASMDQTYKRVDLLIDAVAILRDEGWPIRLEIAGTGRLSDTYRHQVGTLGLCDAITFHGMLEQGDVLRIVAHSDLFVLCSDTEGMPRAMIEAMATGTPCIGSSVGGITELLPPHSLFERGSVSALVSALRRYLVSPALRERSSGEMVARSAAFAPRKLQLKRERFAADVFASLAPSTTLPSASS